jgi:long-subunit acyl-CoA synthetase (AMP-forming)
VSCGNPAKIKEDSAAIKATIFISVPRVFNRIVDAVNNIIDSSKVVEEDREDFEQDLFKNIR